MSRNSGIAVGLFASFFLFIGLIGGAWTIGDSLIKSRNADRRVTVKGLAEKEVKADLAFWQIQFSSSSNYISAAQKKLDQDTKKVRAFLKNNQFDEAEIQTGTLQVQDAGPGYGQNKPVERYTVIQSIILRSKNVNLVSAVSRRLGNLIHQGIVLRQDWQNRSPTYVFTKLNEIKPEMIAQATANARKSAQQFAQDSGSIIGNIRNANQGVFVILPRDSIEGLRQNKQIFKKVRVVSTITYQLEK